MKDAQKKIPQLKIGDRVEDPLRRVWKVLETGRTLYLQADGGGAKGHLNLAKKSMGGWKKVE